MIKRFLLFCIFAFPAFSAFSQIKQIAESTPFEEPEKGSAKLLQMKNGSTSYIYRRDELLQVQLFDATHKKVAEKTIAPALGLNKASIESVFEVNGDLVFFFGKHDDRTPKLYRVVVDGNNGNIKSEKQVAELPKVGLGVGYAVAFGGLEMPDIYIAKDAFGDNYAIAIFNTLESDRGKRIEVVMYNNKHDEVARAYYSSPDDVYKYMRYVDMAFAGPDRVVVLANGYNTRKSGGKASSVYVASLVKGSDKITLTNLRFTQDQYLNYGLMKYNPVSKRIIILPALQQDESQGLGGSYAPYLVSFDPETPSVENYKPIQTPPEVDEKSVELFGRREIFTGLPQDFYIGTNGDITVVSEAITFYVPSNGPVSTILGNIAVTKYDSKGKALSSQFIPKSHFVNATEHPFYISQRKTNMTSLYLANQFKSFSYLNGPGKSYLFFNDIAENGERIAKGKITTIRGVGECDGFYFTLKEKELMPSRNYVFGEPAGKREHELAMFTVADYDEQRNVYVTLKLEKDGRDKLVKIVWMQP